MRTGPFSSRPVIDRPNAAVVPVYAVTEDDRAGGAAPDGERAELGSKAGAPLVPPQAQSAPPPHPPGSLVLHLAARGLGGGGSWGGTAVDWVVFTPAEANALLLAGPVAGTFASLPNGSTVLLGPFGGASYPRVVVSGPTEVVLMPAPEPVHLQLACAAAAGAAGWWRRNNRR